MLDSLKHWIIKDVPAPTSALSPAEQALEVVERGQMDREARLAAEEQARLDAERQAKRDELTALEVEIGAAIREKADLHASIRHELEALVRDLLKLDKIERHGSLLSAQVVTRQMDIKSPVGSHWRDAKLDGASQQVTGWIKRLEGS